MTSWEALCNSDASHPSMLWANMQAEFPTISISIHCIWWSSELVFAKLIPLSLIQAGPKFLENRLQQRLSSWGSESFGLSAYIMKTLGGLTSSHPSDIGFYCDSYLEVYALFFLLLVLYTWAISTRVIFLSSFAFLFCCI